MAMATKASWLDRPAIAWDSSNNGGNCYWNEDLLKLFPGAVKAQGERRTVEEPCSRITYRQLLTVSALVVHSLCRQEESLTSLLPDGKCPGIPVAVAIPEGPLLPLAVLIVHALNSQGVILVPIEPSEAKERNRHILRDVRAKRIFAVPGKDMERLKDLVVEEKEGSRSMVVDDFAGLVREVLTKRKLDLDAFASKLDALIDSLSEEEMIKLPLPELVSLCRTCLLGEESILPSDTPNSESNRISHIVYTSGTTGKPKGSVSSQRSLQHYLMAKNRHHAIDSTSTVLLASALSFDPCLSDILATLGAKAKLAIAPRTSLLSQLSQILQQLQVTHVLCTPTLWSLLEGSRPIDFPNLQVVALGGEPIPIRIQKLWGSSRGNDSNCRLFTTYGVTEACVYQTMGPVAANRDGISQLGASAAGQPFDGLGVRICDEDIQDRLVDVPLGEIVLYGSQLDSLSGYWNHPELAYKFVPESSKEDHAFVYHYRTGDRGRINPQDGSLVIQGRIAGEDGMVKINGVRVELGEIEAALVDDVVDDNSLTNISVVVNAMANVIRDETTGQSEVHAYCVLSQDVRKEIRFQNLASGSGAWVQSGPLWTLLRTRCIASIKKACLPKAFVLIPNIPLSPTGKRDRKGLPNLTSCQRIGQTEGAAGRLLKGYGNAGAIVAAIIVDNLNLQPSQESLLTTESTFDMLGGDSLAATRITRALYAHHHQVNNTRYLGGNYGNLDGPFDVVHLLRARSLGEYVDMLDDRRVGIHSAERDDSTPDSEGNNTVTKSVPTDQDHDDGQAKLLYDSLLQSATLGQASIAMALLQVGADPNFGRHEGRLSKTSGRHEQKTTFRSSPLHLACLKGQATLVQALLDCNAEANRPDASGSYPLHLAASGSSQNKNVETLEDGSDTHGRFLCVRALVEAGVPITMRDANQQSILHAAARAGHVEILEYVFEQWITLHGHDEHSFFQWRDHWARTAVHWTVLNGHVEALRILLKWGCDPNPTPPRQNKRSSVVIETPMHMCERLYGLDTKKGVEMRKLLTEAIGAPEA